MISYDPSTYANNDLRDDKFYKDMLKSMGIPSYGVVLAPLTQQFDITVLTGTDTYFDIGNVALANFARTDPGPGKSLYHGYLTISIYCSAFVGATTMESSLAVPSVPSGSLIHYLYDRRAAAAVDAVINGDNRYDFTSTIFKYLRFDTLGGGGSTYRAEGIFTGLKITY